MSRRNASLSASNAGKEEKSRSDSDSLAVIVAACQRGDEAAQRQMYDTCHQNVFRLAVRIVGLQDAADVTQQVFLQAFCSIGKFNGRSRFSTWLYRLAVNESLQYLRRNRKRQYHTLNSEPIDKSMPGDVDSRELLNQALSRIEPELASIFMLREAEGLSYGEIAEALEIPEGTVGSRLNRARRELRKHLLDMGYEL